MKEEDALVLIVKESRRARKKFAVFNSAHEGYAVILEEIEELWDEIKHNPKDWQKIKAEAVQVGAMALRFLIDLEEMQK